jgi:uncharacterized phage protein (TIGR02220 family)
MRYRKISPVIWQDEKFRAFTDDGKLAFLFLLTHPAMTSVGAMRGTLPGLAAELGWPPRRFEVALAPALDASMVEVNRGAAFIGLPKFLRHNEPEGPNSVKAWAGALELIPECPERRSLLRRCLAYLDTKSDAFKEAMGDGILNAIRDGIADGAGVSIPDPGAGAGAGAGAGILPPTPSGGAPDGALAWLSVLNDQARAGFRPTDSNLRPIHARIREGHTLAEAETVVRAKVAEWVGTDYAKYLRPVTLFGPKFDSYVQASRNGHGSHEEDGEE